MGFCRGFFDILQGFSRILKGSLEIFEEISGILKDPLGFRKEFFEILEEFSRSEGFMKDP